MIFIYSGWLVYSSNDVDRNVFFINWMKQEAKAYGIELKLIIKEDIQIGIHNGCLFINHPEEKIPDIVVSRYRDHMLSKQFEKMGVSVFNPSIISEICNNKAKTFQYMADFNIPMPDTLFVNKGSAGIKNFFMEFPVVVKEVTGHGGKQVYGVYSLDEFYSLSERLYSRDIIIQKMIGNTGKDLRVYVVGKDIVSAILRYSDTDFRANYSLGGKSRVYTLSSYEEKLVRKIADKLPFGMVGIDFLFNDSGELLLNEIEDVVGCRTLWENTNINIVNMYFKYISEQIS